MESEDLTWEEAEHIAIQAGALEPQGFKEGVAAHLLSAEGKRWADTPWAQSRLNAWTKAVLNRAPHGSYHSWSLPMNIDEYWLDNASLERLSRQVPSTDFGIALMDKRPVQYDGILSSDICRGCVVVLLALYEVLRVKRPSTIAEIDRTITDIDDSLRRSGLINTKQDIRAGANLTIANAYDRAHSGLPPWQVVASYESEAIFAAKMFCRTKL